MIVPMGEKLKTEQEELNDMKDELAETIGELLSAEVDIKLYQDEKGIDVKTSGNAIVTCMALMGGAAGILKKMLEPEDAEHQIIIKEFMLGQFEQMIDNSVARSETIEEPVE